MKRKIQKGFTLIELMIVIAIVAILVALAVPAYLDYSIRAKVGECIASTAAPKLNVEEYYQSEGGLPASAALAGTANFEATQFCASITWSGGALLLNTANTGATIDPTMSYTPNNGTNRITGWDCVRLTGENRHVPATCRNT